MVDTVPDDTECYSDVDSPCHAVGHKPPHSCVELYTDERQDLSICLQQVSSNAHVTFHITLFISLKSNKKCFFIKCAVKTENIVTINTGMQCDMKIILLQRRIMLSYPRHAFIHVINTHHFDSTLKSVNACLHLSFVNTKNSFSTKIFQMLEISIVNIPKRIILKLKTNN